MIRISHFYEFMLIAVFNDPRFSAVARVEQEMKRDWLFAPHYRYYVREMRILAYSQLLESYRSLTLGYMAEAFGVSTEFIDQCVNKIYSTLEQINVSRARHGLSALMVH